MKKIGIFGGTFDPPHLAHLVAAECAVGDYELDTLLFVPANIPPHKSAAPITAGRQRLAMTRLAIAGNPRFEASEIELRRQAPSYTIDTILEIKQQRPLSLLLFVGTDQLAAFDTWREPERIFEEAEVVALSRPGFDPEHIPSRWRERAQFLPIPLLEISSTDIRERVRTGRSVRYLVPDAVWDFIKEHRLYR